jgi:hypothetical protein
MKKYLVFAGAYYYPSGFSDYYACFDSENYIYDYLQKVDFGVFVDWVEVVLVSDCGDQLFFKADIGELPGLIDTKGGLRVPKLE